MGVLIAPATLTRIASYAGVVYRGLEPAIRNLKAQKLSLKSIYEELQLPEPYEQNWKIYRRNTVTALSVSLWSSLLLTGGRIIGVGLASVLKHTYTLQHNPTAATWLSTHAVLHAKACTMPSRGAHVMCTSVNLCALAVVHVCSRYMITHLTTSGVKYI